MTTDEHAHVQHLEGLVKRFRSRIAAIDMENKSLEARVQALEQDVETLANSCNSLERETVRLEQERERIRQALERARITCCGLTFTAFKEFATHWDENHAEFAAGPQARQEQE